MENRELFRAIQFFGSQQKLAAVLKVNRKVVNGWLNKEIQIPTHHALLIESSSDGKILSEELAPHAKNQIKIFKKYIANKYLR